MYYKKKCFIPTTRLGYEKLEINFELKLERDKDERTIGYKDSLDTNPHY